MIKFHAVMLDETRCEFGVDFEAASRHEASDWLEENYPESRCVQLETPEESAEREQAIIDHIRRGGDWDDEGRPIQGPDYDYYDEEDEE